MNSSMDNSQKTEMAVAKMSAAVGGATYSLTDLPLNQLVALATLIFVVLQIIYLIIKFYRNITGKGQW